MKVRVRRGDKDVEMVGHLARFCLICSAVLLFVGTVMRLTLGVDWIWLRDLAGWTCGVSLMLGLSVALVEKAHVRIDLFYVMMSKGRQSWIDRCGLAIFVVPSFIALFFLSVPYVSKAWSVFEGSSNIGGMPGLFVMKTVLLLALLLVIVGGVGLLFKQTGSPENGPEP